MMRRVSYGLLILLVLGSVVQAFVYHSMLPAEVASHFRPDGTADGFSSKGRYVATLVCLNVVTALVLGGSAWFTKKLPTSLINLPHKAYWLSAERRSESLYFIETAIVFTAILTVLLFMGIAHLTLLANQNQKGIPPTWLGGLVGGYIFSVMATTVAILSRFGRPPAQKG